MARRLSMGVRNALLNSAGIKESLDGGFLFIYSGAQPASADDAASGTLLAVISASAGATGLTFDAPVSGVLSNAAAETWQGAGLADGNAGWFRFQALNTNKATTQADAAAASTTTRRIDGAIAVSGGQLNMSNTAIVTAAVQTLTVFTITQPAS